MFRKKEVILILIVIISLVLFNISKEDITGRGLVKVETTLTPSTDSCLAPVPQSAPILAERIWSVFSKVYETDEETLVASLDSLSRWQLENPAWNAYEGEIRDRLERIASGEISIIPVYASDSSCKGKTILVDMDGREFDCSSQEKVCTIDIYGDGMCMLEDPLIGLQFLMDQFDSYSSEFEFTPEYEKTLEKYLVMKASDFPLDLRRQLFELLPDYTEIVYLGPEDGSVFNNLPEEIRSRAIISDTSDYLSRDQAPELWAQDLGEGHKDIFYLPITRRNIYSKNSVLYPDNEYMFGLNKVGIKVVRLPIFFQGGNLVLTRDLSGRKLVVIGVDDLFYNLELHKRIRYEGNTKEIFKNTLKKAFNADEVVIFNKGQQPREMFHIDQSFVFLDNGKVALAKIIPSEGEIEGPDFVSETQQVQDYLDFYESELRNLGFKIIYLYTTEDNVLNYQSYTNLIVYINKDREEKHIILPYYATTREEDKMWEINAETLTKEGFIVEGVEDKTSRLKGNVHCISGLLAEVCELDMGEVSS